MGNIIRLIIQIAIGVIVGGIMTNFLLTHGIMPHIILFLVSVYICVILHIVIHEFGHFVAGKMSGYRFIWIGIFKTVFIKKKGKWLRKKFRWEGSNGQCFMSPPEMKNGKYPFVFYDLGGGLMNLLVSVISLVIFFIFFPQSWILVVFAAIGIMSAIVNIVPMGNNDGDGALILSINDKARRAAWFIKKYREELIINDVRPRDICEKQFSCLYSENPLNEKNHLEALIAIPYRFSKLMDKHKFEEAKILAEQALAATEDFTDSQKKDFLYELLFIELIGECRKEKIERLYTKEVKRYIKTTSSYDVSTQRLLYAYAKLFLQNDAEAEKALKKFNKVALSYPFVGEIEWNREMIEIVDRLAEERKVA